MTNQPSIEDQVWGRSLLLGHVHAFQRGVCRCGALPFANPTGNLNATESKAAHAPAVPVDFEDSGAAQ